jgi:hypothetical protein
VFKFSFNNFLTRNCLKTNKFVFRHFNEHVRQVWVHIIHITRQKMQICILELIYLSRWLLRKILLFLFLIRFYSASQFIILVLPLFFLNHLFSSFYALIFLCPRIIFAYILWCQCLELLDCFWTWIENEILIKRANS